MSTSIFGVQRLIIMIMSTWNWDGGGIEGKKGQATAVVRMVVRGTKGL